MIGEFVRIRSTVASACAFGTWQGPDEEANLPPHFLEARMLGQVVPRDGGRVSRGVSQKKGGRRTEEEKEDEE